MEDSDSRSRNVEILFYLHCTMAIMSKITLIIGTFKQNMARLYEQFMRTHWWKGVRSAFTARPMLTNAIVYGTMVVGAEFSQQTINKRYFNESKENREYDWGALGRYAVVGTFINPNILYFWYRWLDRAYTGTATKIVLKKLVLDQFLMTPPLLVTFYLSMSVMEGKSDVFEECRQKFAPTFATSCLFWLPAQLLNFAVVPPAARVIYVGTCSFVWINMLCFIKRKQYTAEAGSKQQTAT